MNDIIDNVVKNHAGRNIVIWGYNATSTEIETLLVDGDWVRDTDVLKECLMDIRDCEEYCNLTKGE